MKKVRSEPAGDAFYLGRDWVEESGSEGKSRIVIDQRGKVGPLIIIGGNRQGKDAGIVLNPFGAMASQSDGTDPLVVDSKVANSSAIRRKKGN